MAPTMLSAISTHFWSRRPTSAGVGLLLKLLNDWAAAAPIEFVAKPYVLVFIEIGAAACCPAYTECTDIVNKKKNTKTV